MSHGASSWWPPREGHCLHAGNLSSKNMLKPQTLLTGYWFHEIVLDPCQGWQRWSSRSNTPDAARCSGLAPSLELEKGQWMAPLLPRGPVPNTSLPHTYSGLSLTLVAKGKVQTLEVKSPLPLSLLLPPPLVSLSRSFWRSSAYHLSMDRWTTRT